MRVMAAQINPTIGDLEGNTQKILDALLRAQKGGVDVVVFAELSLTGYPPEDLLLDPQFIEAAEGRLKEIEVATKGLFAVVGTPRWNRSGKEKPLFNSAAVFRDGSLIGFHHKQLLPTYDVFDEARFFEPGESPSVFEHLGRRIAVTICEDFWQHAQTVGYTSYKVDPVKQLQELEVDLVLNLSSSPYYYGRRQQRTAVFALAARALQAPLVLCNQVGANDQLVFDGRSFYLNEKGELIHLAKGFEEDDLIVDLNINACPCALPENGIGEMYRALVLGTRDYFHKQGFKKALLGLSGGIDSALVACIAKEALGEENLLAFALPSRFSAHESTTDAAILAKNLGIELQTIPIEPLFHPTLDLLEPHFKGRAWDVTEENMQSRIRGQILMALSNKLGALLLNTGNKSEMAMGYTTLYGDMCGGLAVINDVTKTHVYHLANYINRNQEIIPKAILERVPSAELKENQTDQDTLPPYEVLDPIIEDYIEERLLPEAIAEKRNLSLPFVEEIIVKMHKAEYKRRQAPIAIRVTQKAFSKGRNVPIVQKWK